MAGRRRGGCRTGSAAEPKLSSDESKAAASQRRQPTLHTARTRLRGAPLAATPRLTYGCDTHRPWKTEDAVVPGALESTGGAARVPGTPGRGVELDRDALARLYRQYVRRGLRNRDDTGCLRSVGPAYERKPPRWRPRPAAGYGGAPPGSHVDVGAAARRAGGGARRHVRQP
jgi:hypothetical protein